MEQRNRKKRIERKVVIPKDHPPAFKSELWPHEELIRSRRHSRDSYPEIAALLSSQHGLTISPQSVRNFLIRANKRKRQGAPSGWPEPTPPVYAATEENSKQQDSKPEPGGRDPFSTEDNDLQLKINNPKPNV